MEVLENVRNVVGDAVTFKLLLVHFGVVGYCSLTYIAYWPEEIFEKNGKSESYRHLFTKHIERYEKK